VEETVTSTSPRDLLPLAEPPTALVDAGGRLTLGVFAGLCRRANLEEARLRWHGLPLPRPLARLRLKQWQHFGLVLPDLFLGVAIVDAGYLRTSWCFVVDRASGRSFEHRRSGVLLELRVAPDLWRDHTFVHARGMAVDIDNSLQLGEHALALAIDGAPGKPAVHGALRCLHDLAAIQPLSVVLPLGGVNQGMYSHKVALPLEGVLRIGDATHVADARSSFALLDIHRAHYPRHTWWRWATCAGQDAAGRLLALNLTRNIALQPERYTENALWIDGAPHRLAPARFEHDRARPLGPWHLSTEDGAVELVFTPRGERSEELRLGLMRSVFHQLHGTFDGTVRAAGQTLPCASFFGLCEDHDSVW
jgi:hypothetical protein